MVETTSAYECDIIVDVHSEIQKVLEGQAPSYCVGRTTQPKPCCILPGSFNPLHAGHLEMAQVASLRTSLPVEFELSVTNVDKPSLSLDEVTRRVDQFEWHGVWITRATRFVQKVSLFPDCTFVIGADTALRLCDHKYYASKEELEAAVDVLAQGRCRFLILGRSLDGRFVDSATEMKIPARLRQHCEFVSEAEFRRDISSTEMRRNSHRADP